MTNFAHFCFNSTKSVVRERDFAGCGGDGVRDPPAVSKVAGRRSGRRWGQGLALERTPTPSVDGMNDTFPLADHTVRRVGFGAMQLPGPGVLGPPRDRDEALAVLRRAVELGVDHIDTAQFYGPDVANELIREALHPYPENLAIVSKVGGRRDDAGAWLPVDDPADLRRDLENNLRTLGIDQLAAVNLRLMDSGGPDQRFDDQLSVMIAARDEGLIGGIGLSEITREHLLHALGRTEIACVQNSFNLVDRASNPVLEECKARG